MNDMINQPAKLQEPIPAGERSAPDPSGSRTQGDSRVAPANTNPAPASVPLIPAGDPFAPTGLQGPILRQGSEPVPQAVTEPVTRAAGPQVPARPRTTSDTLLGGPSSAPATGRPNEIPNPQPGSEDASNRNDPSREQSRADAIPIRALAPTRAEPPHSEERPDPSTGLDPVAGPGPLFGDPAKTPSHPSRVRPLTTSNVDTGPQYPDDTEEELKGIADGIINSRATSIPARQVKANASRIRGLLKKTCNVKEIYNHLVREGRVDPTKVSYKQFADQVSKLQ